MSVDTAEENLLYVKEELCRHGVIMNFIAEVLFAP